MAGFTNKVKLTVLKGMEAVGQRASNMASSAQQKLQELNLETQRREILSEFPLRAYDLWQKGEVLPEPLAKMMESLSDLDERLGVLRAQRYAQVEPASEDTPAPEEAAEDEAEAPIIPESGTEAPDQEPGEAEATPELPPDHSETEEASPESPAFAGDEDEAGGNA